jgi:hypothetical protein
MRIGSGEAREQLCSFTSFNCGVKELLAQRLLRRHRAVLDEVVQDLSCLHFGSRVFSLVGST